MAPSRRNRALGAESARHDRLCELNVIEQVRNVARTTIVEDAWRRGQPLAVHGWIYAVRDGLLRDLGVTLSALGEVNRSTPRAAPRPRNGPAG
ncbi:MAG: carbonic anhydrase [Thermomicrobiales bacterium]